MKTRITTKTFYICADGSVYTKAGNKYVFTIAKKLNLDYLFENNWAGEERLRLDRALVAREDGVERLRVTAPEEGLGLKESMEMAGYAEQKTIHYEVRHAKIYEPSGDLIEFELGEDGVVRIEMNGNDNLKVVFEDGHFKKFPRFQAETTHYPIEEEAEEDPTKGK